MRAQTLQGIPWDNVESSNVKSLYWDEPTHTICVRFNGGGIYTYIGADIEQFNNLRMAPSIGKYLHNVIKALPYTRWETEQDLLNHLNL
jgi:hypothetical protein